MRRTKRKWEIKKNENDGWWERNNMDIKLEMIEEKRVVGGKKKKKRGRVRTWSNFMRQSRVYHVVSEVVFSFSSILSMMFLICRFSWRCWLTMIFSSSNVLSILCCLFCSFVIDGDPFDLLNTICCIQDTRHGHQNIRHSLHIPNVRMPITTVSITKSLRDFCDWGVPDTCFSNILGFSIVMSRNIDLQSKIVVYGFVLLLGSFDLLEYW